MKKFTIKALLLSLFLLCVPCQKCHASPIITTGGAYAILGMAAGIGGAALIGAGAIAGGLAFATYKLFQRRKRVKRRKQKTTCKTLQ